MSDQREFGGIPVSGDFTNGHGHAEQFPRESFLPLFFKVLENEHVVKFGWRQYTPYFNDGDECVFSASSLWVETDEDVDPEENDNYYDHDEWFSMDYGSGVLGEHEWKDHDRAYKHNEPWVVELREVANALSSAIEGGHYDNVLLSNFGNHVEITVYPGESARIETEYYEHD